MFLGRLLPLLVIVQVSSMRPEVDLVAKRTKTPRSKKAAKTSPLVENHPVLLGLAQVYSGDVADLAARLPGMSVRAALYPIKLHPSLAMSMTALHLAARATNVTTYPGYGGSLVETMAEAADRRAFPFIGSASSWAGMTVFPEGVLLWLVMPLALVVVGQVLFVFRHHDKISSLRPKFPNAVAEELSMKDSDDFYHGMFSCCFPGSTCLYAMFCPCVRHADTLSAAGVLGFWTTILTWIFVDYVAVFVFNILQNAALEVGYQHPSFEYGGQIFLLDQAIADLVRAAVLATFFAPRRAELRRRFGSTGSGSKRWDCISWMFCSPCTLSQEGLDVDAAEGVEVRCCCKLHDVATGELVGTPVKEKR